MEAVLEAGLTRHIGVSNFSSRKLHDLLDRCRIPMNRCSWTTR
jgi:diketogulonate reductase-like aldo/keto reductase